MESAVELAVPPRLSRYLVVWPLEAGTGATPARRAKAASERTRPRCDQATSSWAATIGPTPGSSSSCGASGRVRGSRVSWAARVAASIRRAAQHDPCRARPGSPAGGEGGARSSSLPTGSRRSCSRRPSGTVTITPRSCPSASRRTSTALRRVISSSRSASRRCPRRGRASVSLARALLLAPSAPRQASHPCRADVARLAACG